MKDKNLVSWLMKYWIFGLFVISILQPIAFSQGVSNNISVQTNDIVDLHYRLWTNPDNKSIGEITQSVPYMENSHYIQNVTVNTISPKGLYYGLLNMKKGESKYISLVANQDANLDGFDDITGLEVVSFGNPAHILYNTPLVYWIELQNITQSPLNMMSLNATETSSSDSVNKTVPPSFASISGFPIHLILLCMGIVVRKLFSKR